MGVDVCRLNTWPMKFMIRKLCHLTIGLHRYVQPSMIGRNRRTSTCELRFTACRASHSDSLRISVNPSRYSLYTYIYIYIYIYTYIYTNIYIMLCILHNKNFIMYTILCILYYVYYRLYCMYGLYIYNKLCIIYIYMYLGVPQWFPMARVVDITKGSSCDIRWDVLFFTV